MSGTSFLFDLADMSDLAEFGRKGDPKILSNIGERAYIRKQFADSEATSAKHEAEAAAREAAREAKEVADHNAAVIGGLVEKLEDALKSPTERAADRAAEARYREFEMAQARDENTLDISKSKGVENFFDSI